VQRAITAHETIEQADGNVTIIAGASHGLVRIWGFNAAGERAKRASLFTSHY